MGMPGSETNPRKPRAKKSRRKTDRYCAESAAIDRYGTGQCAGKLMRSPGAGKLSGILFR
jgi:hypothetical protein